MTPFQARLSLGIALAIVLSVAGNLYFLQDTSRARTTSNEITTRAIAKPATAEAGTGGAATSASKGGGAKSATAKQKAADPLAVAETQVPTGVDLDTVRAIQRELGLRGYEPGAPDGRIGLISRASIMAYEADFGLPLTAEPTDALLRHIVLASETRPSPQALPALKTRTPAAEQVARTVQQSLAGLGYYTAKVDGSLGEPMARAIREFEMDNQMPQTGRISGQLVARLARAVADGRRSVSR